MKGYLVGQSQFPVWKVTFRFFKSQNPPSRDINALDKRLEVTDAAFVLKIRFLTGKMSVFTSQQVRTRFVTSVLKAGT